MRSSFRSRAGRENRDLYLAGHLQPRTLAFMDGRPLEVVVAGAAGEAQSRLGDGQQACRHGLCSIQDVPIGELKPPRRSGSPGLECFEVMSLIRLSRAWVVDRPIRKKRAH
jgi:hypothetical protein